MADQLEGDLIADPDTNGAPADGGSPPSPSAGDGDQTGTPSPSGDLVGDGETNTSDPLSGDGKGGSEGDVPETYAFEAPEGIEMTDDLKAGVEEFASTAKELGLSQAQYQKLIEYNLQRTTQAVEQAADQWRTTVNQWRDSVKNDKELGGRSLTQTLQVVEGAVSQFGDAEFRALLRSPSQDNPQGMSIGNHPAVVRFLNRVGKAIGDPAFVTGAAQPPLTSVEDRMYPTMQKPK